MVDSGMFSLESDRQSCRFYRLKSYASMAEAMGAEVPFLRPKRFPEIILPIISSLFTL